MENNLNRKRLQEQDSLKPEAKNTPPAEEPEAKTVGSDEKKQPSGDKPDVEAISDKEKPKENTDNKENNNQNSLNKNPKENIDVNNFTTIQQNLVLNTLTNTLKNLTEINSYMQNNFSVKVEIANKYYFITAQSLAIVETFRERKMPIKAGTYFSSDIKKDTPLNTPTLTFKFQISFSLVQEEEETQVTTQKQGNQSQQQQQGNQSQQQQQGNQSQQQQQGNQSQQLPAIPLKGKQAQNMVKIFKQGLEQFLKEKQPKIVYGANQFSIVPTYKESKIEATDLTKPCTFAIQVKKVYMGTTTSSKVTKVAKDVGKGIGKVGKGVSNFLGTIAGAAAGSSGSFSSNTYSRRGRR